MLKTVTDRFVGKMFVSFVLALMVQISVVPYFASSVARAQGVRIELDEVSAAIKGQDVAIYAQVNTEVDEMRLYIRKLLEMGEYTELPMEKTGQFSFRIELPLSQEQGELGRLEYYLAAFDGGNQVAKTDEYVLSFIDPPFVGEVTSFETPGIDKELWKQDIKGKISRPFYTRWYLWALVGAAGVVTTAVLAGGGSEPPPVEPLPPVVSLELASPRRNQFGLLCNPQAVQTSLSIQQAATSDFETRPFDVVYTLAITGGNTFNTMNVVVDGVTPTPSDMDTVTFVRTYNEPGEHLETWPSIRISAPSGTATGTAFLQFSAVVKDGFTDAVLGNPTPGTRLESTGIPDLVDSDPRVVLSTVFDVIITTNLGC